VQFCDNEILLKTDIDYTVHINNFDQVLMAPGSISVQLSLRKVTTVSQLCCQLCRQLS